MDSKRKEKFLKKLHERASECKSVVLSKEKYDAMVEEVVSVKIKGRQSTRDHWLLKHYDVLQVSA